jgi:hypothetical protein
MGRADPSLLPLSIAEVEGPIVPGVYSEQLGRKRRKGEPGLSSSGWVLPSDRRPKCTPGRRGHVTDAACLCVSATECPTAFVAGAVRMTNSTGASKELGSR